MQQTIVQLPMQPPETPTLLPSIGIIYQQPPPLLPVIRQDREQVLEAETQHQEQIMPADPPTPSEIALLKAVGIFKYFSAEKLAEYLQYKPGSLRGVKKRLQLMEQKKLVEVANKQNRANESPFVYTYGK